MPRLDQLLARNTHYSRAEVRQLLKSGAVSSQSGAPLDKLDEWVEPAALPITVCVREMSACRGLDKAATKLPVRPRFLR